MRWNAHHLGQPVVQSSDRFDSAEDHLLDGEVLDFALDNENEFVLRVEPSKKSSSMNDAHIYQVCLACRLGTTPLFPSRRAHTLLPCCYRELVAAHCSHI